MDATLSWSTAESPRARTGPSAQTMRAFRDLLISLTWRDLRVRYKQSLLGLAWCILTPLTMMLVFTFLFTRAMDLSNSIPDNMPYALYAYLGLAPWMFFSSSLGGCVNSLAANRNLVTKVYFPREVFPLSCIAAAFVDFLVALFALGGLMVYFEMTDQWHFVPSWRLALIPMIVILQIALTIGAGMLLAMGNLFYRDVRQVFAVGIQLLMFLSGVVVPVPHDDSMFAAIVAWNPLVPLINAYRTCVNGCDGSSLESVSYAATVSFAVLLLGVVAFRRVSHRFAECI